MDILTFYSEIIYFIVFLIIGTLITRYIAKAKEWDSSYTTAYIVISIWTGVNIILEVIVIVIENLYLSGIHYNFIFYIFILVLFIINILRIFLVKGIYKKKVKESISMVIDVLFIEIFMGILYLISINYILYYSFGELLYIPNTRSLSLVFELCELGAIFIISISLILFRVISSILNK